MDPTLRERLTEAQPGEELEVILKLRSAPAAPPQARIVARFGDVVTARVRRDDVKKVWDDPGVISVKAPRLVTASDAYRPTDVRAQSGEGIASPFRAAGICVAALDWGIDIAHPDFRLNDGRTRFRAIWHQGLTDPAGMSHPYGYGQIFDRSAIDTALAGPNPYEYLGFHPAESDPKGEGCHGTHVLSIAAGRNSLASAADLVFVHLATGGLESLAPLGDTVRILEALDFVRRVGGERWCANLSLGRHSGPHSGKTVVEEGIDALLVEKAGRAIVQSCGNYFGSGAHSAGRLRPGKARTLHWRISPADKTPNEMDLWLSHKDRFLVEIEAPGHAGKWSLPLGEDIDITSGGGSVGHAYHRAFDPIAGDHQVQIYLKHGAPSGVWRVTLTAVDVVDGRYHAWVERDAACADCQSTFEPEDVVRTCTLGSIASTNRAISVGAVDAATRAIAAFSSAGPTRDGRIKPDLVAPGVSISAARSAPLSGTAPLTTVKSGTSMAAPTVTSVVAAMMEAAGRPLSIQETRTLLLGTADPAEVRGIDRYRVGSGHLNAMRAISAAFNTRGSSGGSMSSDADGELLREASDGKMNFVILSGGPGPYDSRDVEHDKSWSNYVDPPLLLGRCWPFWEKNEQIWWFVYKPAYVERWKADTASGASKMQKAQVERVKKQGFASYVELLEDRAKDRCWELRWLEKSGDELWKKLKTFRKGSVTRLWYWGHAHDDLWLTVAHDADGDAEEPDEGAILRAGSIDGSVLDRFAKGDASRPCRFVGCNTTEYAKQFAKKIKVWTEGVTHKIDFGTLHQTGGYPCLVHDADSKASATGFDSSGAPVPEAGVDKAWKICGTKPGTTEDVKIADVAEEKMNFALLSGGPGLYDTRDVEHDKSWANYVTPPLLLAQASSFWAENEKVWWFIYRPAYDSRWSADNSRSASPVQREHADNVRKKGFRSYVDMLEGRARERGWELRWLSQGSDLWDLLRTLRKNSVTRLWYWGHARSDLWLAVGHGGSGRPIAPAEAAMLKVSEIDASVKDRFATVDSGRPSRFIGCNTTDFAKGFARTFSVWSEGILRKVDFGTIHATGGNPCLVRDAGGVGTVTAFDNTGAPLATSAIKTDLKICGLTPGTTESIRSKDGLLENEFGSVSAAQGWLVTGEQAALMAREALISPKHSGVRVIGKPGRYPSQALEPGDVIVRCSPGELTCAHAAVLADRPLDHAEAAQAGWQLEHAGSGQYALVVEEGMNRHTLEDRFGRRVLDGLGRVPPGQVVIRPSRNTSAHAPSEVGGKPAEDRPKVVKHWALLDHVSEVNGVPTPVTGEFGNPGIFEKGGVAFHAGLQVIMGAALRTRPQLQKLQFAVADLTADVEQPMFAGHRALEQVYIASTAKLACMLAAFQLREDLNARSAASTPSTAEELFAQTNEVFLDSQIGSETREVLREKKPKIELDGSLVRLNGDRIPLPRLAAVPKLDRIFDFHEGRVSFRTGSESFDELSEIVNDKKRDRATLPFHQRMWMMIGFSDNAAAATCIHDVGYLYIGSSLARWGLYDLGWRGGLWLGGDYSKEFKKGDWRKDPVHGASFQSGNAAALVAFMVLIAQKKLVSALASEEMRKLMSDDRGLVSPLADVPELGAIQSVPLSKIGIGDGNGRAYDAVLIERRIVLPNGAEKTLRYAAAALGVETGEQFTDLALMLDECVRRLNRLP